ncbi:MAG: hypothetical protein HOF05_11290 [Rhodospirillales bacterium]|nr:hypothetical protein [Rhodospirillales bacterium]
MAVSKLRQVRLEPFAMAAQELRSHGLAVLPLDDKEPRIQFKNWSAPPGKEAIEKFIPKFGDSNIGIICHLSGVTVVDIDDPSLIEAMLERFGDTPLRTATPRGGVHLWYQHNGEHNRDLRTSDEIDVDIKGHNGIIVVPPSVRQNGQHEGKPYQFVTGSWDDLPRLPKILPGALNRVTPTPLGAVKQGWRNTSLFKALLRQAHHCDNETDLIDVAKTINDDFPDPLPEAEVIKTAKSAWDIHARGENWSGKEARFQITRSAYNALSPDSNALNLFHCLQFSHGARSEPFAVSPKAMRKANVIPGWGVDRYTNARNKLESMGAIKCIYRGGRKPHDPSMFTFDPSFPLRVGKLNPI